MPYHWDLHHAPSYPQLSPPIVCQNLSTPHLPTPPSSASLALPRSLHIFPLGLSPHFGVPSRCLSISAGPHACPHCVPPQAHTPVPTGFPDTCICSPKSFQLEDSRVPPDVLFSFSPTDIPKQRGIWVKTGHWFCNK